MPPKLYVSDAPPAGCPACGCAVRAKPPDVGGSVQDEEPGDDDGLIEAIEQDSFCWWTVRARVATDDLRL